jgi:hypothetical protein
MGDSKVGRIGELALAWLLTRPEGRDARSALAKTLRPLVEHRWSSGEWKQQLDQELRALQEAGHIELTPRGALVLTDQGREHALKWLGLERLRPGTKWAQLKSKEVLGKALGLQRAGVERISTAPGLRSLLLQRQLGLGGSLSPTQVMDRLCWKQLGLETDQPFTLNAVRALLLGRELGATRTPGVEEAFQQLSARAVGARRTDTEDLRLAVLRSWVLPAQPDSAGSTAPVQAESAPQVNVSVQVTAAPQAADQSPSESLQAFAERVLAAAYRVDASNRFGPNKVFISHVWRALQGQGLDEQSFKNRLVQANNASLLTLSRADLVEAMNPEDVAASRTPYLDTSFHFITLAS